MDHHKRGKTQLFRRKQSMKDLERIFKNIREHTNKGYYRKPLPNDAEPKFRRRFGRPLNNIQ